MLTTMRTVELLDESDHVANMVLQSDVAENYRQCLYRLYKDSHAQALIAEFVKVRDVKRQVDLHATIAAFKKAESELQKLLDEISVILGQAVSEHVKVPTGNPFFDTGSSCGGGCGSGGSCGCSA